jgi:transcription elongation factor Elf1
MELIKCPNCGNTKRFYESNLIVRINYFEQHPDGYLEKVHLKENNVEDSCIFCEVCDHEISEGYHLFLDRYTESLFKAV